MSKKRFITGLLAAALAIGFLLTGCEGTVGGAGPQGPTGPAGAPSTVPGPAGLGVNGPVATTLAGVKAYFKEGNPVVYLLGEITIDANNPLTLEANETLVVATYADLNARGVTADSVGRIRLVAGGTLTLNGEADKESGISFATGSEFYAASTARIDSTEFSAIAFATGSEIKDPVGTTAGATFAALKASGVKVSIAGSDPAPLPVDGTFDDLTTAIAFRTNNAAVLALTYATLAGDNATVAALNTAYDQLTTGVKAYLTDLPETIAALEAAIGEINTLAAKVVAVKTAATAPPAIDNTALLGAVNALVGGYTDASGAAYKDNAALFAAAASTTVSAGKTSSTGAQVDAVAEAIVTIADVITGLNAASGAFTAFDVPAVLATPTLAEVQSRVDEIAASLRAGAADDADALAFLTATTFVASGAASPFNVKLTYNDIFLNKSAAVTGVPIWTPYTIVAGNVAGSPVFANVKFYINANDGLANGFTTTTTYAVANAALGAAVTQISIADAGKYLYAIEYSGAGSGTVLKTGVAAISVVAPEAATVLVTVATPAASGDLGVTVILAIPDADAGTIAFKAVTDGLVEIDVPVGGEYTDIEWKLNGGDVTEWTTDGKLKYQLPPSYATEAFHVQVTAKLGGILQSGGATIAPVVQ